MRHKPSAAGSREKVSNSRGFAVDIPGGSGNISSAVAPLPQLDRGTDYESVRRGFESLTAHHFLADCKIGLKLADKQLRRESGFFIV